VYDERYRLCIKAEIGAHRHFHRRSELAENGAVHGVAGARMASTSANNLLETEAVSPNN